MYTCNSTEPPKTKRLVLNWYYILLGMQTAPLHNIYFQDENPNINCELQDTKNGYRKSTVAEVPLIKFLNDRTGLHYV